MEKSFAGKKWHIHFWFVIVTSLIFMLLLYFHYSTMNGLTLSAINLANSVVQTQKSNHLHSTTNSKNQTFSAPMLDITSETSDFDSCMGKYFYVHNLPSRFNHDLLVNCHSLLKWWDMCPYLSNMGLGSQFPDPLSSGGGDSNDSWFATSQFMLEVIFHNRMKQYECLTNNSSLASVVFVPFYAGLEAGRNLWNMNKTTRDFLPLELVKWLVGQPEWNTLSGRDHFLVSGRIGWDFRREDENGSDWGNRLMFLPESKNMTMLSIESTCWNNDVAIPYPTYFHPSTDNEVYQWQSRMRREKRRYLFSFAGASRPDMKDSIRNEIINQCQEASGRENCNFLNCNSTEQNNCENPVNVMNMFRNSVFCLQPTGDSYTRRSIFDSMLAGCIPVFFSERSAYYVWHLPKNYTKYSVFIPVNDVKHGKVKIAEVLQRFSAEEVVGMREEVIRLIPKVVYANPKAKLETIEDAFDIAVKGMLERVKATRRDMLEGRTSRLDFGEKISWK